MHQIPRIVMLQSEPKLTCLDLSCDEALQELVEGGDALSVDLNDLIAHQPVQN